ncbi:MAG: hypothetical protein A2Y33_14755 [Spirochaetes bacterium GWF1_51_8]|nr:MAG: hypothetical protein A2Y33_14755 [Spirochaetes bacterium GWF1_51_8]
MKKIALFILIFGMSSSCALLHFLAPGAQNSILQLSGTKGWVQLGEPVSNLLGNSANFSFDVDSGGKPYIVIVDTNQEAMVMAFEGSWVEKGKTTGAGIGYPPILHFINTCPNVAIRNGTGAGYIYDFCTGVPQPVGPGQFASGFSFFDFKKDKTEQIYTVFQTNLGASYMLWVKELATNGSSWNNPANYNPVFTSMILSYLKMEIDQNKHPYVLWTTNSTFQLLYQKASNLWTNYTLGKSFYAMGFCITPENKIMLLHQSNNIDVYLEVIDISMGVNPALYTRPVISGVTIDYDAQNVATSIKFPQSCYLIGQDNSVMEHKVYRVNQDGSYVKMPDIPEIKGSAARKLFSSQDGTIYIVFVKSNGTGFNIYTYRLIE